MAIGREHEIHRRRQGRNIGLGLVLAALGAIVFGLTIVKVTNGNTMQAFDHQPRVSITPAPAPEAAQ